MFHFWLLQYAVQITWSWFSLWTCLYVTVTDELPPNSKRRKSLKSAATSSVPFGLNNSQVTTPVAPSPTDQHPQSSFTQFGTMQPFQQPCHKPPQLGTNFRELIDTSNMQPIHQTPQLGNNFSEPNSPAPVTPYPRVEHPQSSFTQFHTMQPLHQSPQLDTNFNTTTSPAPVTPPPTGQHPQSSFTQFRRYVKSIVKHLHVVCI